MMFARPHNISLKNSSDHIVRQESAPPRKPKIGIALGAGVARGWSHIGVLQELAEHGIFPDVIAGTSIGAVVGGCYAAGCLDQLTEFALSLTRRRVLGFMDLSLSGLGLFAGTKLKKSLEKALADVAFETLAKSFAVVATDMVTGHEVWLRRGDLVTAIRASYALPGIFEPVQIDGHWLFDGALVNPVPVNVCRALGADMVIAVTGNNAYHSAMLTDGLAQIDLERVTASVEASPWRPRGVPGIARAVMGAFDIAQDRISRSRLAGDPPDVMISAHYAHIGMFDFHRAAELIAIGREAARHVLDEITCHKAYILRDATDAAQAAE